MWRGVRRPGEAIGPVGRTGRCYRRGHRRDLFWIVNSYQDLGGGVSWTQKILSDTSQTK